MRRAIPWALALSIVAAGAAAAQAPSSPPAPPPVAATGATTPGEKPAATATASKTEVSVGEAFVVEVRTSGPPGVAFTFPPAAVQESFELATAPPDSAPLPDGAHRYVARVFAIGDAEVPPIPVGYRLAGGSTGEVQTAAIPLRVVSLLPKEPDEQKLADVRAPVAVGVGRAFWIALAIAVLLAAAIAWWIVAHRRRPAMVAAPAAPALAPDEDARRALDALIASGRLARGEYRPFYIELTLIAKRYLERRLAAPIVEMTTVEMLAYVRATPAGVGLAPALRDLAGAADQIKFARGAGLTEEAERHLAATRAMIDTLETALRPVAPAGGQAA